MPPLSPQPSDLSSHFLGDDPTHIAPLLKIPFPGVVPTYDILQWRTISSWYFESWESVYFDILHMDSKLQRFKIIIKPDLSDASLHVMNMAEVIISDDLTKSLETYKVCEGYRICEDTLVYYWNNRCKTWGAYAGLISAPFTNVVTRWNGRVDSLCPASGRFVYTDNCRGSFNSCTTVVVDLFWQYYLVTVLSTRSGYRVSLCCYSTFILCRISIRRLLSLAAFGMWDLKPELASDHILFVEFYCRSSYFPLEQFSAVMEAALTLASIPLDLQITICIFLHPSDILALRKVCYQSTLNLWVA